MNILGIEVRNPFKKKRKPIYMSPAERVRFVGRLINLEKIQMKKALREAAMRQTKPDGPKNHKS